MPASKSRARKRPATPIEYTPGVKSPEQYAAEQKQLDEPKAAREPLLPNRWWDHAAASPAPQRREPILVVSHQVAEVLNMGIDRAIDVAEQVKNNLEVAEHGLVHYRREYEWLRDFMRRVRDRIGPVNDGESIIPEGGPQYFLEDLARSIDLLERGLPT